MRTVLRDMWDGFEANDLLTSASAMSFQVLTALVPSLLFLLGLMGFLGLDSVWQDHVRPTLAHDVSPAVLQIADDTVHKVLASHQVFWVTFGAALSTWQLSGAVRAVMGVLNRVYGVEEDRGWRRRYGMSIALAAALGILLVLAVADVTLIPLLDGHPSLAVGIAEGVGRWVLAAAIMLLAVGLLVHNCPNRAQPLGWVTSGSVLVGVGWTLMSLGFLAYLTEVASYGSVFGDLATVVVLLAYLYLVSAVFLGGLQLDALLRERAGAQRPGATLNA